MNAKKRYREMTQGELAGELRALHAAPDGSDEIQRLVHDLQTHQIELEMQNRELREAQAELEASRDRYADLYDFAPIGYLTLDERWVVRQLNFAAAGMLGSERSRIVGFPLRSLVAAADLPEFESLVLRFRGGDGPYVAELGLQPRSGAGHIVARLTVVRDNRSGVTTFRVVMADITELRQAQEQQALLAHEQAARLEAERSAKAKDEFLALLSHELRTPLTAVMMYSQLLQRGGVPPDAVRPALDVIVDSAKRQARLINDLLDVSRINSGKLSLSLRLLHPAEAVESAAAVRPTADIEGVTLESVLDRAAGPVRGDPDRLQQVVVNLLANAIKFTPRGGRVTVALERAGEQAVIRVTDTGQGIPADVLPQLFDAFRQADAAITRARGGLGLGLSIVRRLVEKHGGTVEARSDGAGRGAEFTVRLPLTDGAVPPAAVADAPSPAPAHSLDGVHVLLVEDEPHSRTALSAALTGRGAKVTTAGTAAAAMEAFRSRRPDVLLSDIAMPGEDGYTLMRRIRALPAEAGGRVPACALTAFAGAEDRRRALAAGFQEHLAKPVAEADLAAMVAALAGSAGRQ